ncbi:MAG: CBS domain-containing protein [Chloroflexi bacterium]|nr:CBS domain-containing protein [Chloroflexota bacterium]
MPRRRTHKPQRLPPTEGFARRTLALRAMLNEDSAAAGDQAIKVLEEYLESLAQGYGYYGDGSLGRYASFLRGRDALDDEMIDRIDTYTQVRNCLAHSYGLQTTPDLAAELVEFVELLLKRGAPTAAELMTRTVRTINEADLLAHARDLMIRGGYGRIPVLRDGHGIVGLLIERDLVVAQAAAERNHRRFADLTVAEALPPAALERAAFVAPEATREQVADALAGGGIIACLVTPGGTLDEPPLGIITHADLLYRM